MRRQSRFYIYFIASMVCISLFFVSTCSKNKKVESHKLIPKTEMKKIETKINNAYAEVENKKKSSGSFDSKIHTLYSEFRDRVNKKDTARAVLTADTLIRLQTNKITVLNSVIEAQDTLVSLLATENKMLKFNVAIFEGEKRRKVWKTVAISAGSVLATLGIIELFTK